MTEDRPQQPRCDQCGLCCRGPMILITKPSDYRRWVNEGRVDILKYATEPSIDEYGDIWPDVIEGRDPDYCPFIIRDDAGRFSCSIQETKPEVCREFFCEWAFGIGKKGVPFHTDAGWTDRAKKLGYGQADS